MPLEAGRLGLEEVVEHTAGQHQNGVQGKKQYEGLAPKLGHDLPEQ
jgi:hypothetical protein